jgi:hypothetical protein
MNDIVVFLILAGIALIFKWLGRGSEADAENRPPAPNDTPRSSPMLRPAAESEEERVRRFLEALGMPSNSTPPLPVRRHRSPVPLPVRPQQTQKAPKIKRGWAQPLPPLVTVPEAEEPVASPLPAPVFVPAPPPQVVTAAPLPAPPVTPVVRPAVSSTTSRGTGTSLGELLRSAGSARQAIVLREVLGPSRGLQPFVSESWQQSSPSGRNPNPGRSEPKSRDLAELP